MKNIILFTFLLLPLFGFSQNNKDSIIVLNPQAKTNPNLLLNSVATNLSDAGKSYTNSDNFRILGTISMVVGSLIYQKNKNWGQVFIAGGLILNINSLFDRYNGHRSIEESGENLRNYTKSLK